MKCEACGEEICFGPPHECKAEIIELKPKLKVTRKRWMILYHTVNNMMAELGVEGEICATDKLPCEVMSSLADIDGGVYDDKLT